MGGVSSVSSGVGAGVSQVHFQRQAQVGAAMERGGSSQDVNAAVLQLIRHALSASGVTGHDLDVMA